MKKIVCDICKNDIRYNGVKVRFKSIFACFFRKIQILSKHNSDSDRLDLCEKCFNKLRELILNPNTIQDLRTYLPGRIRNALTLRDTPTEIGSPHTESPPESVAVRVGPEHPQAEEGANGR